MVESVLPKNTLNRVSFSELLRMEEAFSSQNLLLNKKYNSQRKTSIEDLFQQLSKLFPDEGKKYLKLKFST